MAVPGAYIDTGYLRGFDPMVERSSLMERARGSERNWRELDNRINWRWFIGEPYFIRAPMTSTVVGMDPLRRRTFLYVNLARDVVRTLTGTMWYEPDVDAFPLTSDPGDIIRAEADQHIARHNVQEGGLSQAFRHVVEMCHLYGHGFIKALWDPFAGSRRPMVDIIPCPECSVTPDQGGRGLGIGSGATISDDGREVACVTCSAQGVVNDPQHAPPQGYVQQYMRTQPEGDVKFVAVHPDDMVLDPDATCWEECETVAHRMRMSPESAWRMYGSKLGIPQKVFEESPKGTASDGWYGNNMTLQVQRTPDTRYVTVTEYYKKPDQEHPEGVFALFLGEEPLYAGPMKYLADSEPFPFFFFGMYESQGSLFPKATMDLILPLVLAYNDHVTAMHKRGKESARLRFMVPESTGLRLNDDTGNLHYKDAPNRPAPKEVAFSPYPQDASNIQDLLLEMIDRLSGATDAVRGTVNNADSARALAFLEERSVGPLRPIIQRHASQLDRAIKYGVCLAKIHYGDGRLIRAFGTNGSMQSKEFRLEDMGEGADVRLRAVKNVGRSRAALMSELNEAADRQMIDPETYLELSEFGDMGALHDKRKPHRDLAEQENQWLDQTGQMPIPFKYQTHKLHMDAHGLRLNSYIMRDPNDPRIQTLLQHMDLHQQMLAQEQVQQQIMQQQAMATFGAANAANPDFQPAETQQQVAAQGGAVEGSSLPTPETAPSEPFANEMSQPGGTASYADAAGAAAGFDQGMPPTGQ